MRNYKTTGKDHERNMGHHEKGKPLIIDKDEGEESQIFGIDEILHKIMKENVPKVAENTSIQIQETQRMANNQDQKRKSSQYIILKILRI